MLGEFSGQQEPDSGLDFPRRDGRPLVVVGQTGSLDGDPLEDVVDERVHDRHRLGRDTSVGVDLFQDLSSRKSRLMIGFMNLAGTHTL